MGVAISHPRVVVAAKAEDGGVLVAVETLLFAQADVGFSVLH